MVQLSALVDTKSYNTAVRLRMGYYGPACAVILVMMAMGGGVQTFATLFVGTTGLNLPRIAAMLFVIPVLYVVLAIMVDQCVEVTLDAMDYPPLARIRARLMVGAGLSPKGADAVVLALLEGIPLLWALKSYFFVLELSDFFTGYIEGGIVSVAILCALRAGLQARIAQQSKIADLDATIQGLQGAELLSSVADASKSEDAPSEGYTSLTAPTPTSLTSLTPRTPSRKPEADGQRALRWLAAGLLILLVLFVLFATLTDHELLVKLVPIVLFGMTAAMLCFSKAKDNFSPGGGKAMNFLIVSFFFCTVGVLVSSTSFLPSTDDSHMMKVVPASSDASYTQNDYPDAYPICNSRWGHAGVPEKNKLLALDLTLFNDAMYGPTKKIIIEKFKSATKNTDLDDMEVVDMAEDYHFIGRWAVLKFPRAKTQVFVIRGTASASDVLADVDLFGAITLLGILDKSYHVLGVIPHRTIRNIIKRMSFNDWFGERGVWMPIVDKALELKKNGTKTGFASVIVGHSLGGNLAATAGALVGIPTLAISPPGSLYTMGRFTGRGYDSDHPLTSANYAKHVTVIRPDPDPVPMVDKQEGMTQHIACDKDPITCHYLTTTFHTLHESCHDPRGRTVPKK